MSDIEVPGKPVAWAVELANGEISEEGWLPMPMFKWTSRCATLREGAKYVFAYRCPSDFPATKEQFEDPEVLI